MGREGGMEEKHFFPLKSEENEGRPKCILVYAQVVHTHFYSFYYHKAYILTTFLSQPFLSAKSSCGLEGQKSNLFRTVYTLNVNT